MRLFLVVIVALLPLARAAAPIPQWGSFETAFRNERRYADPFRDVTLEATSTARSAKRQAGGETRLIALIER